MILGDKIILLRKKNGFSQEELGEKLNVSRQSISKWEGAQSIPTMDKIIQLSEIFGVSTDFLLKDSIEEFDYSEVDLLENEKKARYVSMELANEYLDLCKNSAHKFAYAIALCILAPMLLIGFSNIYLLELFSLNAEQSSALGLTIFFIVIAFAVSIFIRLNMKFSDYEYLKSEAIETQYGVSGMVKSKMQSYKETYNKYTVIGIIICILSVLPVIIFNQMNFISEIGILVTLTMVAIGVFFIVTVGYIWSSFKVLLQEDDYTVEGKSKSKIIESIAVIYWLVAVAIYLFISFYYGAWDRSWIVWPVAGVSFAALMAITNLFLSHKSYNR